MALQHHGDQPRRPGRASLARGHLLHLGLDLQVDALLFTVSAASLSTEGPAAGCAPADDATLPWYRWLLEDLDALLTLAEIVVQEDVDLPAGLAGATHRQSRLLEDLRARYQTVLGLLSEAETPPRGPSDGGPALGRLREHYQARLGELDACPARRADRGTGATVREPSLTP